LRTSPIKRPSTTSCVSSGDFMWNILGWISWLLSQYSLSHDVTTAVCMSLATIASIGS
jgi:hypothetical protein